MPVHVGEIHTEVSARPSPARDGGGPPGAADQHRPGAAEDAWRRHAARVAALDRRTCAGDSDD